MKTNTLIIKRLAATLQGNDILKNVSLTCTSPITAILGPSGSGKTTLLRCLAQLIPCHAETLTLNGRPLHQYARGSIGLVFQQWHLFAHMTCLKNLTFAPVKNGMDKNVAEAKAFALMEQLGIANRAELTPNRLSGGQKQRLAVARALMMDPPLLLLDEPTSALDPELVNEVGDLIKSLAMPGCNIIVVTHELRLAKRIADDIVFMHEGRILDHTSCEAFFECNNVSERAKIFLEHFRDNR